jgi:hypothetical protein
MEVGYIVWGVGVALGLERPFRGQPAGRRTHRLVWDSPRCERVPGFGKHLDTG